MPIVSANWAELITPQTTEAFYMGFTAGGRRSSMIPSLYRMENSERAYEDHIGVGQLSSRGWSFEKSGRVQYDAPDKGFKTTFTHVEFAKGFLVQRKLIEDNLTQLVFDRAENLGDAAFRQREKSAANLFANAFTASGTDADGFAIALADGGALCSATHKSNDAGSGSTQSNTGTTAFSKTAVADTRQLMLAFTDDVDDVLDVIPDALLVPPELEDTALEITKSVLDPNSANNAVNPQAGRFRTIVWHYLTDANNWFMLDSGRMKRDLIWYERVPVEFAREQDFDTLQAKFRAYMRYSRAARDWRWVYGHAVT